MILILSLRKLYILHWLLLFFSLCSVKQGLVIIVVGNHGLAAVTLGASLCLILVDVRNTPISTTVPVYIEKKKLSEFIANYTEQLDKRCLQMYLFITLNLDFSIFFKYTGLFIKSKIEKWLLNIWQPSYILIKLLRFPIYRKHVTENLNLRKFSEQNKGHWSLWVYLFCQAIYCDNFIFKIPHGLIKMFTLNIFIFLSIGLP